MKSMTSTHTIVAKKSGVSSYLTTKYIYIYTDYRTIYKYFIPIIPRYHRLNDALCLFTAKPQLYDIFINTIIGYKMYCWSYYEIDTITDLTYQCIL